MEEGAAIKCIGDNSFKDVDCPLFKKKRNLPGTPDPDAEVIALSPKSLMETNRFSCELCGKGFQRDQNLQLHRRGHNLPWKLRQRKTNESKKRVYVCPEKTCIHHHPSRALGDLTGVKKHFCRKHGEKKWKCDRCPKRYAVHSDWKAHSKICGTREYRCDCGTLFSRRDSFVSHRAFCTALAQETARVTAASNGNSEPGFTWLSYPRVDKAAPTDMEQLFSVVFEPVHDSRWDTDQTGPGLSLWTGEEDDAADMKGIGFFQLQQKASMCSEPLQLDSHLSFCDTTDYRMDWVQENKLWISSYGEEAGNSVPISETKEAVDSFQYMYSFDAHDVFPRHGKKAADTEVILSSPSSLTSHVTVSRDGLQNHSSPAMWPKHAPVTCDPAHTSLAECCTYSEEGLIGGQTRDFLGIGVLASYPPSLHG